MAVQPRSLEATIDCSKADMGRMGWGKLKFPQGGLVNRHSRLTGDNKRDEVNVLGDNGDGGPRCM